MGMLDHHRHDRGHIRRAGDQVVAEPGRELAADGIHLAFFPQREPDPLDGATDELTLDGNRIDRPPTILSTDDLHDRTTTGQLVNVDNRTRGHDLKGLVIKSPATTPDCYVMPEPH
nr:hypothetical protein [Rhodococcus rhodochrous]